MAARTRIFAALAALALRTALADDVSVTFDAALTNGTGWAYSDAFVYSSENKAHYIKKSDDGSVRSPDFGFAVTSVTVVASKASDKTTRNLFVAPLAGGKADADRAVALSVTSAREALAATWAPEAQVGAIAFYSTSGNGSVYLHSAVIRGVPTVAAPTDPDERDVYRERFTATWRNPPDAVANEIDVTGVTHAPFQADYACYEDFAAFTNGATQTEITARLTAACPDFGGERLYAPPYTNGIVRIGSRDDAGVLTFRGVSDYAGRHLVLRAWRDDASDEGWIAPVDWTLGGETNAVGAVFLDVAPGYVTLPLDGVPGGAALAVHSATNRATETRANGRVYVDGFGIATRVTPASVTTATVARAVFPAASRRKVRGLNAQTRYEWAVRALGEGGGVSEWTGRRAVETGRRPAPRWHVRVR